MNPVVRRVLTIVTIVLAGFLILQLASVLMAMSIYSWFFQTIRNASGMPDALNGAISIWLVAIVLMLLPTFFSAIFFRKTLKKVLIVAGALSGWVLIVYFMSLPKEGQFFNPMTGQTMYRYARSPDGKIDLFPLGYKFHPRYGTELELVTPEIIKEIDRKATEAVMNQEKEQERQRLMNLNLQNAQREKELAQQRAEASERREKEARAKLQFSQREKELAQQRAEAKESEQQNQELDRLRAQIKEGQEKVLRQMREDSVRVAKYLAEKEAQALKSKEKPKKDICNGGQSLGPGMYAGKTCWDSDGGMYITGGSVTPR
ncbi:MAG: hypothetical protein AAB394_00375 [Patescibacteria group bacterium]